MAFESGDHEYSHFIDGEFVESTGDERIAVSYPYTGETWGSVPEGTAEDVDRAVDAAREALPEWKGQNRTERRDVLQSMATVFEEHADELAELETRQNGKLIREMKPQMFAVAEMLRHYASLVDADRGEVIPLDTKDDGVFNYVVHEPYGVVGGITPWNSPVLLGMTKLVCAIAAGNTFVHKPSEQTPISALRVASLLSEESDLPDGVYNVVTGAGKAGAEVSDHEGVDHLSFTGGTEVGRRVGEAAGRNINSVTLELGGKSPNIIFPSADVDNAVNGVMKGVFAASGQTCVAGSRVFVHESLYDEVVETLVSRASDVSLGDPLDPQTEMGPLAYREHWESVKEHIDTAVEDGATVAYGGERPADTPGECFMQPTILTDVENDMRVAQEEIFGPVTCVMPFSDEEEVVEKANETRFGLAAGVWSEDMRQIFRVTEAIEAGTIWVNEYRIAGWPTPFGGFKDSGVGREQAKEGLDEYRQTKSIWIDKTGEVDDPFKIEF
ncbi:aldehyde dehydrogenase family protein [Halobellus sp. GM3]|uniref:aldehyde dehydrogenase family protein n=1 Tax=Halobellus sp. GM3 TaxID=3458410 RepID=UPI00403D8B5B